jgi:methionyl aminopeptidase
VLHDAPHVANSVPPFPDDWPDANFRLKPGMLLAVEPIIAVGTSSVLQKPRQWPIRTGDGSLSVHYEHDVLITEDAPTVLTTGLEDLPMMVG